MGHPAGPIPHQLSRSIFKQMRRLRHSSRVIRPEENKGRRVEATVKPKSIPTFFLPIQKLGRNIWNFSLLFKNQPIESRMIRNLVRTAGEKRKYIYIYLFSACIYIKSAYIKIFPLRNKFNTQTMFIYSHLYVYLHTFTQWNPIKTILILNFYIQTLGFYRPWIGSKQS